VSEARRGSAVWHALAWASFGGAYVGAIVFVSYGLARPAGDVLLVLAAGSRLSAYIAATVTEVGFLTGFWADGSRRLAWLEDYVASFSASADLDPAAVAAAPELTMGRNQIRLQGMVYRVVLDLQDGAGRRLIGELAIEGAPGRLMPPLEIHGAGGWRSGYVVPVMSGRVDGELVVNGQRVAFTDGAGYHDHNWGFWEGVSWQWGQVQHGDLSLVYGRIFPPPDAADADRIPGFLALIGPDGPIGYATNVSIDEENAAGTSQPAVITVTARSVSLDLTATFSVKDIATNRIPGPLASTMDFLQMRGLYKVEGRAADRSLSFEAQGSAETFRGR
jgi:hypothetical protein